MKQKIYSISHYDFDEYSCYEFTHPNNKLEMEFEQDVADLIKKHLPLVIPTRKEKPLDFGKYTYIGNGTIVKLIASKLPELGYIKRDDSFKTIDVCLHGSSIIDKKSEAKRLLRYCGTEIIESIIEYNKEIRDDMYKRIEERRVSK